MTDITINIKTGPENSEPKVTAITGNDKSLVPKAETPKVQAPKIETKEEPISGKETPKDESAKKDDSKKMGMTEEEHANMSSDKTKPSEKAVLKQEVPKEEMKEGMKDEKSAEKDDSKKMSMTDEEHAKMSAKK
jgi:hypothetical protein